MRTDLKRVDFRKLLDDVKQYRAFNSITSEQTAQSLSGK